MNRKQGFYAMFYLLQKYVDVDRIGFRPGGWDLPSLYSNMWPHSDKKPHDMAYWNDWQDLLDTSGIHNRLDNAELLKAIRAFVKRYEDDFGFDLWETLIKLNSIDENDPDLSEAIEKAERLLVKWGEPL